MSYAAIELLDAVRRHLTVVTRLRFDARLFDPPPARPARRDGRGSQALVSPPWSSG
jgi:hypothetical protein